MLLSLKNRYIILHFVVCLLSVSLSFYYIYVNIIISNNIPLTDKWNPIFIPLQLMFITIITGIGSGFMIDNQRLKNLDGLKYDLTGPVLFFFGIYFPLVFIFFHPSYSEFGLDSGSLFLIPMLLITIITTMFFYHLVKKILKEQILIKTYLYFFLTDVVLVLLSFLIGRFYIK